MDELDQAMITEFMDLTANIFQDITVWMDRVKERMNEIEQELAELKEKVNANGSGEKGSTQVD